jgi:hypothetical protein
VIVQVETPHTILNVPALVEVARVIAGPVAVPPPAVRVEVPGADVIYPKAVINALTVEVLSWITPVVVIVLGVSVIPFPWVKEFTVPVFVV